MSILCHYNAKKSNFVFAFVIFIILFIFSCSQPHSHNEYNAKTDIFKLANAIKVYQKDNSSFPGALEDKSDYRIDNKYLCEILQTNHKGKFYLIKCPSSDPWGHPYQIWFDNNGDRKILLNNGSVVNNPIAVWSYGKNGIDEYGSGDDVTISYVTE